MAGPTGAFARLISVLEAAKAVVPCGRAGSREWLTAIAVWWMWRPLECTFLAAGNGKNASEFQPNCRLAFAVRPGVIDGLCLPARLR